VGTRGGREPDRRRCVRCGRRADFDIDKRVRRGRADGGADASFDPAASDASGDFNLTRTATRLPPATATDLTSRMTQCSA